MVTSGIVLGHRISKYGIEVDQATLAVIEKQKYPENVKRVRSFLGHTGFYRTFIRDFLKINKLLCCLLEKDTKFNFNEDYEEAF